MIGRRYSPGGWFHPLVPPIIELKCKCGGKVTCVHPANEKGYVDTPDGWNYQTKNDNSFKAKCNECCISEKALTYFDLQKFGAPFYSASVGTDCIWGWNKEHFQMIINYLEGKEVADNRWRIYRTFIPGKWKSKSRKNAFVKAAKKAISTL